MPPAPQARTPLTGCVSRALPTTAVASVAKWALQMGDAAAPTAIMVTSMWAVFALAVQRIRRSCGRKNLALPAVQGWWPTLVVNSVGAPMDLVLAAPRIPVWT